MGERTRWRVALVAVAVILAIGIVETARSGDIGLLGLLVVAELIVIGLASSIRRRPPVVLRPDLAAWLETTASIGGEPTADLADRAVSAYRTESTGVRDD